MRKSTSLQLHAIVEDIEAFVRDALASYDLYAAVSMPHDFSDPDIKLIQLPKNFDGLSPFSRVFLRFDPFNLGVRNVLQLMDKNPNTLVFEIPIIEREGLREIQISSICESEEILRHWRKLIRKWKKNCVTGAWIIGPNSSARVFYKSALATKNAIDFSKSTGIRLMAAAGWNYYEYEV